MTANRGSSGTFIYRTSVW